jgi:hypothetical protein
MKKILVWALLKTLMTTSMAEVPSMDLSMNGPTCRELAQKKKRCEPLPGLSAGFKKLKEVEKDIESSAIKNQLSNSLRNQMLQNFHLNFHYFHQLADQLGISNEEIKKQQNETLSLCQKASFLNSEVKSNFLNFLSKYARVKSIAPNKLPLDKIKKRIRLSFLEYYRLRRFKEQLESYLERPNSSYYSQSWNPDMAKKAIDHTNGQIVSLLKENPFLATMAFKDKSLYLVSKTIFNRTFETSPIVRTNLSPDAGIEEVPTDIYQYLYSTTELPINYPRLRTNHSKNPTFHFFYKQILDKDDAWAEQLIEKELKTRITDLYQGLQSICQKDACAIMRAIPGEAYQLVSKLKDPKEKLMAQEVACSCSINPSKEELINPWVSLGLTTLTLASGIGCIAGSTIGIGVPLCVVAASSAASLTGVTVAEIHNQRKEYNKYFEEQKLQFIGASSPEYLIDSLSEHSKKSSKYVNSQIGLITSLSPSIIGPLGKTKRFFNAVPDTYRWSKIRTTFPSSVQTKNLLYGDFVDRIHIVKQIKNPDEVKSIIRQKHFGHPDSNIEVMKIKTTDGEFTLWDLQKKLFDHDFKDMKNGADNYLDYTKSVYAQKSTLSENEIEHFFKVTDEMKKRMMIITNQTGKELQTKGGIAAVFSKNTDELLPLEREGGIRLVRQAVDKRRIAEVVRFTSQGQKDNPRLSRELIRYIRQALKSDNKLNNQIYVFTSPRHSVFYRRLGIPLRKLNENEFVRNSEGSFNPVDHGIYVFDLNKTKIK